MMRVPLRPAVASARPASGSAGEVFLAFLRLGLTSFGGPVAHLGYFRAEFVTRRRWIDEAAYADLVALCQVLPGPASSQVGFALGLGRAGWRGGLAAWTGFTLPSAAILALFAESAPRLSASPLGGGLLHGLKLVAVAVVAQAVWGMARSLCPDGPRAVIAGGTALLALLVATTAAGPVAIAFGALAGIGLGRIAWGNPRHPASLRLEIEQGSVGLPKEPGSGGGTGDASSVPAPIGMAPVPRRIAIACLTLFAGLLLVLPLWRGLGPGVAIFEAFYRAGALVFGGGHVVVPLLHAAVVAPGWVTEDAFLAGYGAAQAVPGPLFTVAAYLGVAMSKTRGGLATGWLALVAIFLPGLLLLVGTLPFWAALRTRTRLRAALRGTNAAVVGLLGAALGTLWADTVAGPADLALASAGIVMLVVGRVPPLVVVCFGAAMGIARGALA